mgnify:CR=1 FL=1
MNNIERIGVSVIAALFWVVLFFLPQESEFGFVLWAAIYYLPFLFFGLLLIKYLFQKSFFKPVNSFFQNRGAMAFNLGILILISIFSWTNYFYEASLLIFLTNVSSFTFSIFTYNMIKS